MCLLKQYALFIWDEQAQCSFDAVKQALVSTLVLSPWDYIRCFFLYLDENESTLKMVLFHEYDSSQEHVIYYLSKGLSSPEFRYSQVEKLAREAIHDAQILRHYILPRKMTIV